MCIRDRLSTSSKTPSLSISRSVAAKTGEIEILSVEPSMNKSIRAYLSFNLRFYSVIPVIKLHFSFGKCTTFCI